MHSTRKQAQYQVRNPHRSKSVDGTYNKSSNLPNQPTTVTFTGLLQLPKFKYSKETEELLKVLMKESKMTMMMRKQIDCHLHNGEPLPRPRPTRFNTLTNFESKINNSDICISQRNNKNSKLSFYKNQPQPYLINESFPKTNLKLPYKRPRGTMDATPAKMIDKLFDQINERAVCLAKIEELGEGRKYRDEICSQIAQRLRQIKSLEAKIAAQKYGCRYVD